MLVQVRLVNDGWQFAQSTNVEFDGTSSFAEFLESSCSGLAVSSSENEFWDKIEPDEVPRKEKEMAPRA